MQTELNELRGALRAIMQGGSRDRMLRIAAEQIGEASDCASPAKGSIEELADLVKSAGAVAYVHDPDCAQWRQQPCDKECGRRAYAAAETAHSSSLYQRAFLWLDDGNAGEDWTEEHGPASLTALLADVRRETIEACAKAIEATIRDSESIGGEAKQRDADVVRALLTKGEV